MEPISIIVGTLLLVWLFLSLTLDITYSCPKFLQRTVQVKTMTSWHSVEVFCLGNPMIYAKEQQLKTFGYVTRIKR